MKLLLKLIVVALIANAAWRVGNAYLTYYRFKDAIEQSVLFGEQKTRDQLRRTVLDLATQYDVPLENDNLVVRRDDKNHTFVEGTYTQVIDLVPGYHYPWDFAWKVDVLTLNTRQE
jgi:hypothetical protein